MKSVQGDFRSKNLFESAFLAASGEEFIGVEKEGDLYLFVFKNKEDCEAASQIYYQNKGTVVPKKMSDAIRNFKDLIFSKR